MYDVEAPDVTFKLDCPDAVTLGEDFEIKVALQNQEDEARSVHVRLSAVASFYTGVTSQDVGVVDFVETLAPKEGFVCRACFAYWVLTIYEFFVLSEKTRSLPVPASAYSGLLRPESLVSVFLKGTVKESGRAWAKTDVIAVRKPELVLMVRDVTPAEGASADACLFLRGRRRCS